MRNWKKFSVGWEVGARGVGVHGGDETDATEMGRSWSTKGFVGHTGEFGLYPAATREPLKGFK